MESTGNPNGDSTSNVVEGWQRRLLQLDRRNNLLYFKPGRTATLIADHAPDEIASLLDSSPRGLTFDYAEPRSRPRGANRFQAPNAQPEESEETEPYVREGDLQSDCTPPELQRKLGNLTFLEVWNRERFVRERIEQNPITSEDEGLLEQLGI